MTRSALPIFKGGTKRGRNPLKLLGGAGKMAARAAHTLYARSPIRSASGARAPVTPKPTALSSEAADAGVIGAGGCNGSHWRERRMLCGVSRNLESGFAYLLISP